MIPAMMLGPGRWTVLGSLPRVAHQTHSHLVHKLKATTDVITEPVSTCFISSGVDMMEQIPNPYFLQLLSCCCCSGLLLCSQEGQNLLTEGFF